MPFQYKITEKKEIEITGYEGEVRRLMIPERIADHPVTSVGSRAFYGREDLREVWLPEGMTVLKSFAFYGCPNLHTIHLADGVEDYYDGVIRQCASLAEITVRMRRGNYRIIREMLGDNDRQLLFRMTLPNEEEVCLIFPAYLNDFVEDTMARAIHLKIEGAGYPFRECVLRSGIRYQEYDRVFFRAAADDDLCAVEIALLRLMYPHELSKESKDAYRTYLTDQMGFFLHILIDADRMDEVRFLAKEGLIPQRWYEDGILYASERKKPQMAGVLLDAQKRNQAEPKKPDFFVL